MHEQCTYLMLSLLDDFLAVSGYCPLGRAFLTCALVVRTFSSSSSPSAAVVEVVAGRRWWLLLEEVELTPTTVTLLPSTLRSGERSEMLSPPPPPPPVVEPAAVLWRADWEELLNSEADVTYIGLLQTGEKFCKLSNFLSHDATPCIHTNENFLVSRTTFHFHISSLFLCWASTRIFRACDKLGNNYTIESGVQFLQYNNIL